MYLLSRPRSRLRQQVLLPLCQAAESISTTPTRSKVTAAEPGEGESPGFTEFSVYKGKGAVLFKPLPARWKRTDKGKTVLDMPGKMLAVFAPVSASKTNKAGNRAYSWQDQKIMIALNVQELGAIMTAKDKETLEFYHDPSKGKAEEGAVHKSLSMITNADGSKIFTARHNSKAGDKRCAIVQMTVAEFHVFKSLAEFCIPRFVGFDVVLDSHMTYVD